MIHQVKNWEARAGSIFWPGSEPSPHVAKAGNAPAIRSHANLNPTLPSIESWLVNSDPYIGLLWSPYHPLNNQGYVHCSWRWSWKFVILERLWLWDSLCTSLSSTSATGSPPAIERLVESVAVSSARSCWVCKAWAHVIHPEGHYPVWVDQTSSKW